MNLSHPEMILGLSTSQDMQWGVDHTCHQISNGVLTTLAITRHAMGYRPYQRSQVMQWGVYLPPQVMQWVVDHTCHHRTCNGVSIIPAIRHAMEGWSYQPSHMQWSVYHTCHHKTCSGVWTIPAITGHAMGCRPYCHHRTCNVCRPYCHHRTCNGVLTVTASPISTHRPGFTNSCFLLLTGRLVLLRDFSTAKKNSLNSTDIIVITTTTNHHHDIIKITSRHTNANNT